MSVEIVAPKRVGPHPYGLLSTLGTRPIPQRISVDDGGLVFVAEPCEGLEPLDLEICPNPALDKPPAMDASRISDPIHPHGAYISLTCSSVANSQEAANKQVLRHYRDNIQHFIGQQFYLDLLNHPSLNPQGDATAAFALALGQGYIAGETGRGSVVFAPAAAVSVWTETHLVFEKDGRLVTSLGNLVVIIPEPLGVFTVFITDSIPDIYVSEPTILEDTYLLRTLNSFVGVAEGSFAIAFDPCILLSYDLVNCC